MLAKLRSVSGSSISASSSAATRKSVDRARLFFREARERLALHEFPFHRVERRQSGMFALQPRKIVLDAEQLADEILEIRRQFDDQLGARFVVRRGRIFAGLRSAARIIPEPSGVTPLGSCRQV